MKITIGMLLGAIITIIIMLLIERCEKKPIVNPVKIDSLKVKIDTLKAEVKEEKKEVKELKTKKAGIKYTTKFDTIPVYNPVLVNLIKCDSVVKIGDSIILEQDGIIQNLDTIVKGQEDVIGLIETDNKALQKQIKKEKRKLLLTKIGAVAVIILTIIAVK